MKKKWDLKRLLFSLSSLVDLGQEVTSAKGYQERMKTALYIITGMFSVPKAALLVYHAKSRSLELLVEKGLGEAHAIRMRLPAKQVTAFAVNEPFSIHGVRNTPFFRQNSAHLERLQAKLFIPLFAKEEFVGAIILGKRLSRPSYLQSEKHVLKVIAHQMAITLHNTSLFFKLTYKAAENKKLYENMRRIYYDTIQAFAAAIDVKDAYTRNHSYRVARYAVAIARELGWKERDIEGIYVPGLLHDIGKITIDREIINKRGKLTEREMDEINRHSRISYDILSKVKFPWKNIAHFVRHHHERPDGQGYPDSLLGQELSEGVKILALADAFDAMTTDRPYRRKLTLHEAFEEVKKSIGTQFDRKITNVFFGLVQKEMNGEAAEIQILPLLQDREELLHRKKRLDYDA